MPKKIRSIRTVKVAGKRDREGKEAPFRVRGHRGKYYYVLAKHVDRLKEINEAYKPKLSGVKPLDAIDIIGKKGLRGEERPFLVRGLEGWYYCVLAEHVDRLKEINNAYRELSKAKPKKIPVKEEVPEIPPEEKVAKPEKKVTAEEYLEDWFIDMLKTYPGGIGLEDIARVMGVDWNELVPISKKLIKEGKIEEMEGGRYRLL